MEIPIAKTRTDNNASINEKPLHFTNLYILHSPSPFNLYAVTIRSGITKGGIFHDDLRQPFCYSNLKKTLRNCSLFAPNAAVNIIIQPAAPGRKVGKEMTQEYRNILRTVIEGNDLTEQQCYDVFTQLMDGELDDVPVAGLLAALATKGHSVGEITGAARAMRERAVRIQIPEGAEVVDIVGTGGTGISTFNVSTATCFVAAGAGAKVAKHGNITNTRVSGSADVLKALGVNIDVQPEVVTSCIAEAGVGFCFARNCHPAMKNVVGVRKKLPVRTIFNVLGPLTNPAGAERFLLGAFSREWTETLAEVLGRPENDRSCGPSLCCAKGKARPCK